MEVSYGFFFRLLGWSICLKRSMAGGRWGCVDGSWTELQLAECEVWIYVCVVVAPGIYQIEMSIRLSVYGPDSVAAKILRVPQTSLNVCVRRWTIAECLPVGNQRRILQSRQTLSYNSQALATMRPYQARWYKYNRTASNDCFEGSQTL
jgi:hypothetical protein